MTAQRDCGLDDTDEDTTNTNEPNLTAMQHYASLLDRYGSLLTLADVAKVFRYPSVQAARKARVRGSLPVTMCKIPPRRGWFATAAAVAEVLSRIDHRDLGAGDDNMT